MYKFCVCVRFYVQFWECWSPCTSCRWKTGGWRNKSELSPWRRNDCSSWALSSLCLSPPRAPRPPLLPLLCTPATLTQVRHTCYLLPFVYPYSFHTLHLDRHSLIPPQTPPNPDPNIHTYMHTSPPLTPRQTPFLPLCSAHGASSPSSTLANLVSAFMSSCKISLSSRHAAQQEHSARQQCFNRVLSTLALSGNFLYPCSADAICWDWALL